MNISINEFKLWFIISFILFAIAFIERAGRPMFFFAVIFFFIGIFAWLEHEYNEYQNKQKTENEDRMRRMSRIAKRVQTQRQPRDSDGRFIKNKNRR